MFDAKFSKFMKLVIGGLVGSANPPKPPPPPHEPRSLREERFGRQALSSDKNWDGPPDYIHQALAPGADIDEEEENGNWQTPAIFIILCITLGFIVFFWPSKARAEQPTGWVDRGCAVYKQESLRLMPGQCIENGARSDPNGPDIVFHPGRGDLLIIIEGTGRCLLKDGRGSIPCDKKFDPRNRVDHMIKVFLENQNDRVRVIMPESPNN